MNKNSLLVALCSLVLLSSLAFRNERNSYSYVEHYGELLLNFKKDLQRFPLNIPEQIPNSLKDTLTQKIHLLRTQLKSLDFWLRYLDPLTYKKLNGPLPVEWETEVFEKFEKPYRREGAGLTLAELYLQEPMVKSDSLFHLVQLAEKGASFFLKDSIQQLLLHPDHFFFCNRLFLLNLSAIYTSGFECPSPDRIVPELRLLLNAVDGIYSDFETSFPDKKLSEEYHARFLKMRQFVNHQSDNASEFDHFGFVRDYINPLFQLNQKHIKVYQAKSHSLVDYSLNDNSTSIFSKDLYFAQNTKGIYSRIRDPKIQEQIRALGEKLFYDPLLSGNNERSCASCHKPENCFADTSCSTNLQFNKAFRLTRNTPSLLNVPFQHLLMQDGRHITLQEQSVAVITNSLEMHCGEKDLLKKLMSCVDYKKSFTELLTYTPQESGVNMRHVTSALTSYYSSFSQFYSDFDLQIRSETEKNEDVASGYNIFMSKAQCATCHFPPQFNGVKPPFVSSEFEVIGVPSSTLFIALNPDTGRYGVNPAFETRHAFRTSTLRNIAKTGPYMHNGVFKSLSEVVDFYDAGGGAGLGLKVTNQTLSSDSLHLSPLEKKHLILFMESLTEHIPAILPPSQLPISKNKSLNTRKTGGVY